MKSLFKTLLLPALLLTIFPGCKPEENIKRVRLNFNVEWKFNPGDIKNAESPEYDDSGWRILNLPHDWSIEGKFSKDNPATAGGGALPGGIGWYRKTFVVSGNEKNKQVFIDFDGVYRNSEVWINGHSLGTRPYGYSSFEYDLTPYLNQPGQNNVLAVKVDNSEQPNSRWYSGSGIYRNVWLVTTGKIHVGHWGTFVKTPEITSASAKISLSVNIVNSSEKQSAVTIKNVVYDQEGKIADQSQSDRVAIEPGSQKQIDFSDAVSNPHLWSVDDPYLYSIHTTVESNGNVVDEYDTPFGIRYFDFNTEKGFSLNGKSIKIKGVCDHHDLGCLGAAINTRAIERQLELLKDMGCNAIRTSHNPPAPELLDLCDKMGFLVMDEAFDMWKMAKTKYDYSLDWDTWHKRDLEDMILRDRNHPGIILWSIGNEIMEQSDPSGIPIAKELAGIVKNLDDTRYITSALNEADTANYIYKSGALDIVGFNYHIENFETFPKLFPGQKLFASETTSALATRGHYDMPSDKIRIWPVRWDKPFVNPGGGYTCSAYDNCHVPWGSTHEETWKLVKKYDYVSGLFIWTGFDYLGEPTPYTWPARSSYFGIIDLAGFPKDAYYMYQSEWTGKPVLHIFPHWNWKKGQSVDVWAYFNTDEVELFLNGKSLGTKRKTGDEMHVMWKVPFDPGKLKAVGRTGGTEVISEEIKTAGKPSGIVLKADRDHISADGSDLSFVTVEVVDSAGTVVPDADNLVNFKVTGNASIAGVDNGDPVSHDPFKADYRKAFNGKCLVVIQAKTTAGVINLTAESEGLNPFSIEITTQ
jgi:beta-galactosidase